MQCFNLILAQVDELAGAGLGVVTRLFDAPALEQLPDREEEARHRKDDAGFHTPNGPAWHDPKVAGVSVELDPEHPQTHDEDQERGVQLASLTEGLGVLDLILPAQHADLVAHLRGRVARVIQLYRCLIAHARTPLRDRDRLGGSPQLKFYAHFDFRASIWRLICAKLGTRCNLCGFYSILRLLHIGPSSRSPGAQRTPRAHTTIPLTNDQPRSFRLQIAEAPLSGELSRILISAT